MSKIFSPQAPAPAYVPPPPPVAAPDQQQKVKDAEQAALLKARGRAATYLTGGAGLTSSPSTSRRTLIGV